MGKIDHWFHTIANDVLDLVRKSIADKTIFISSTQPSTFTILKVEDQANIGISEGLLLPLGDSI